MRMGVSQTGLFAFSVHSEHILVKSLGICMCQWQCRGVGKLDVFNRIKRSGIVFFDIAANSGQILSFNDRKQDFDDACGSVTIDDGISIPFRFKTLHQPV